MAIKFINLNKIQHTFKYKFKFIVSGSRANSEHTFYQTAVSFNKSFI